MLVSLVFGEWFRLSNVNIAGDDRSTIPAISANYLWFAFSVFIFQLLQRVSNVSGIILLTHVVGFPLSNILFPQYEDITQAMSLVRLALSGG